MAVIQRFFKVPAGSVVSAGTVTLGTFDEKDSRDQYKLRKVRIQNLAPYAEHFEVSLTTPGGIEIGPIDLPLTYNVELPVMISLRCPVGPATLQTIMCIASDLPDSPNLYGATHFVLAPVATPAAIPDAAQAITVFGVGAATFFDAGMVAVATVAPTMRLLVARPRIAKFVSVATADGAMMFHY
jgi:hypothetical protein